MPPTKRQLLATQRLTATLVSESRQVLEQAREVCHHVRNDAQRRANRRALDKARARK